MFVSAAAPCNVYPVALYRPLPLEMGVAGVVEGGWQWATRVFTLLERVFQVETTDLALPGRLLNLTRSTWAASGGLLRLWQGGWRVIGRVFGLLRLGFAAQRGRFKKM